ncbi:MAG TPA: hypothetical protein VGZ33_06280 [Acidimicrobiales bacterium]|nr:hypothetical protein [Acidimicrobiales bacterium]
MRKSFLFCGAVATALALSACGSSTTAKKEAIDQFVASFGSSADVQVHLTASFTGPTTANSARVQKILKEVSMDVNVSNPSGAPLSQAAGKANSEILLNYGTTSFLAVREVDSNLYVKVDVSALASIPGVNISSSQAAEVQLVFGGRWFELPKSLFNSLVHTSKVPKAQLAADQATEAKVLDALSNLIDTTSYKTLSNGYSESGTLSSVEKALAPAIPGLSSTATTSTASKGTYALTLTTSGSTVSGVSISVSGPYNKTTMATGSISATIAHAGVTIRAPSPVTAITPSLLASLGVKG